MRENRQKTRCFAMLRRALKKMPRRPAKFAEWRAGDTKGPGHQDDEASLRARGSAPRARETIGWKLFFRLPTYVAPLSDKRGEFVASLGHIERAIEILGAEPIIDPGPYDY